MQIYEDYEAWLKDRDAGIGGSDASVLVETSPFKTLQELWFDKVKHQKKPVGGPAVEYGKTCEPALRTLYQAKHLDQEVQYMENACLVSKFKKWMRYSPDGLIWEPETGRKGILEIKTAQIRNGKKAKEWDCSVPLHYYIQILHGLLVTGFDFVTLTAELRYWDGRVEIVERSYSRDEVFNDIKNLDFSETVNYQRYFATGEMPPMQIDL